MRAVMPLILAVVPMLWDTHSPHNAPVVGEILSRNLSRGLLSLADLPTALEFVQLVLPGRRFIGY